MKHVQYASVQHVQYASVQQWPLKVFNCVKCTTYECINNRALDRSPELNPAICGDGLKIALDWGCDM